MEKQYLKSFTLITFIAGGITAVKGSPAICLLISMTSASILSSTANAITENPEVVFSTGSAVINKGSSETENAPLDILMTTAAKYDTPPYDKSNNSQEGSNELYDAGNWTYGTDMDETNPSQDSTSVNGTDANTTTMRPSSSADLISVEQFDMLNDAAGDLWLPLCIIGIICNILNFIVFLDRSMRNATSYYLAAISFFQVAYIISSTVTKTHQLIYGEIGQRQTKFFYQAAVYFNNYIGTTLSREVYCLVMLVSLERMMAIVFPLRRARSRLVKSPIICIVCLTFLLFTAHVYSLLKFYVYEKKKEDGTMEYGLMPSEYSLGTINAFSMAAKVLFVYLPLVGILIFNIILCVALKRHSASRKNLQEGSDKRRENRERQTTIAILVSTCIFFLLALPVSTNSIISNISTSYNYFSDKYRYTFLFMQLLGSLLGLISYSTDFLTYVTMSAKFRQTFLRKCLPCCLSTKTLDQMQASTKKSFTRSSNVSEN